MADTDMDGLKAAFICSDIGQGNRRTQCDSNLQSNWFDPARMAGHLSPEQQETLRLAIEDYVNNVPYWMVNRAADVETGNDIHLTGQEVKLTLEEDINRLRTMKCYRGVRHASGNKVRGQRGRSNGRGGLTLGVSRKKA